MCVYVAALLAIILIILMGRMVLYFLDLYDVFEQEQAVAVDQVTCTVYIVDNGRVIICAISAMMPTNITDSHYNIVAAFMYHVLL